MVFFYNFTGVKRMSKQPKEGMLQVYTGNGKGKTTAAIGMAIRACGHGWKVLMISFMKGDPSYGEAKMAGRIPNFELIQSGLSSFVKKGNPSREDLKMAREGMEKARKAFGEGKYEMVILDEINVAVNYGLISLESVIELIAQKPKELELVLTGRYAHPEVVKRADMVSEILDIKHPYMKGIVDREGIEH